MHSGTLSFPSWINEFQSLEYLYELHFKSL